MKILVYNVAAEDGGGLFVLKNFYEDVKRLNSDIEWTFFISADILESTDRIKIEVFKETKESWLKRWFFENYKLPKIIESENFDIVISLQNMPVKKCDKPQLVYLHQSLQYCPKKFSLLKSEERGLAIRQKLICGLIKKNIKKAKHVFVQTEWIKSATMDWVGFSEDEVTVVPVTLDINRVPVKPYVGQNSREFFYPARAEIYKNHKTVIEASKILKRKGIDDFRVIFTINSDAGVYEQKLSELSAGLPIDFIGNVEYEKIWDYYSRTILLFPSYLETCGLPMLEAKMAKGRIIASDTPFSHEALDGYANADFFEYNNAEQLAQKMKKVLADSIYYEVNSEPTREEPSLLEKMIEFI